MKMELNDETLTAYALGELDAAETKAVEKLLADAAKAGNTAPREALDEIRAAAQFAEEAFAEAGATESLTDAQREAVTAQVAKPRPVRWGRALALAAGIVLIATAFVVSRMDDQSLMEITSEIGIAGKKAEPGSNTYESLMEIAPGIPMDQREQMEALGYGDPSSVAGTELKKTREELGLVRGAPSAESAPRSGSLQNVQVGGSLRVRGNWYSENDLKRALTPQSPAASPQSALPGLQAGQNEQLSALGYVTDGVEVRTRIDLQRAEAKEQASRDWRYHTARADYAFGVQPAPVETPGTEAYAPIADSAFVRVTDQPLSTFSIDVDTASYSNVRRFLQDGQLPPPNAVRVEELINYFDYAYPAPTDGTPFASHFEAVACPWAPQHTLVRIGLKGREVPRAERPASNLVFLIDVSGSMQPENKLPLVKRAMKMLAQQLDERDRVTIVTYASGVSLALPPTNAGQQYTILSAIDMLGAGGSTNGEGGIQLAYESARRNFLPGGVNRVILATDGDFNVGISDNGSLQALIQQEAKSGVFLSVFGFGMGNLKDDTLETLADKGNGVYGYIDSEAEARKVFVEKLSGTLVTIAKDVKIQVEFNPARVAAYRLVGYENRALAAQDFNNDRKDAGEIGAGHTVTALYEVVPTGLVVPAEPTKATDPLRYQQRAPMNVSSLEGGLGLAEDMVYRKNFADAIAMLDVLRSQYPESWIKLSMRIIEVKRLGGMPLTPSEQAAIASPNHMDEMLLVKLRYKEPQADVSKLLEFPLKDARAETMSADLKFACAVAAFGKLLRGSPLGALSYNDMLQLAQAGLAASDDPHRAEMVQLMQGAQRMLLVQSEIEARRNELRALGYAQ